MRRLVGFLAVIVAFIFLASPYAYADGDFEESVATSTDKKYSSKAMILVEMSTGQVLGETNAHEKLSIASLTKIMTLLLVAEQIERGEMSVTEKVKASSHANSMGGSQIWLMPGEEMTVDELLRAVVIQSANDACVTLAERAAGTEEAFVKLMNERAKQLGMSNTHFVNSVGFDAKNHYSTAYDIAILSREIMKHDIATKYMTVWYDELRGGETMLVNTNELVKSYDGIAGIKTGTEKDAGYCISACAIRGGFGLVAVVLGGTSDEGRFDTARSILDYGFASFELFTPMIDSALLTPVKVLNGVEQSVGVKANSMVAVVIPKGKGELVEYTVTLAENVTAPVEPGQALGTLSITLEGNPIHESNIVAWGSVEKMSTFKAFFILLKSSMQM